MKRHTIISLIRIIVLGTAITSIAAAQQGTKDGQWLSYGGDKGSTKYAPLDQIARDNFSNLEIAWQWTSIDAELAARDDFKLRPGKFEATPLMANGVLYTSTSFSQVAAIDAGTGETLWTYDPGSWRAGRPANLGFIHRGVSWWSDGDDERIIIATGGSQLIALNAKTGKPYADFGDGGKVNLLEGLNRPARVGVHQVNSPPIICRDVIVVGSVIFDRPSTQAYVRGDIRGFDVRTGKQLWQFHSIPQAGEFGNDTWENDSWKYTGNTNVWSLMSADEELGYVYLPFGVSTNDFYGGHRLGDNLFANSLVCLNAETGERVWHFQTVHHDVWDYDLPCAPNLVDVVVDGKPIKAVAQMGKTGFCYVFDRVTGEPIWPIEEVAVPQSTVPGEKTSPTQPIPTKPPPFSAQGLTEDNLIDFTPELRQEALEIIKDYDHGPIFTPPSEKGTITVPSDGGGANWMGAAFDPESSIIYVPSTSYSTLLRLVKPDPNRSDMRYLVAGFTGRVKGPSSLPLIQPPYSRMTAIDLKTGTHTWMTPIGGGVEGHPRLKDLDLPPTGGGGLAFPLVTKTLLFGAHGDDLLALDKATGDLIATLELKDAKGRSLGNVTGAPITYMHEGKQYIVLATTGGSAKARLVALALP
ncbi:MAG: pyrroloquinoline quinone-dependent dehydrogenase [Candidatus Hydrogenedentes bacterium]|nr:pyrroloquinoline quinone-dependent dehydrogenase [Candidatus Hydrogenedentota bacterium]